MKASLDLMRKADLRLPEKGALLWADAAGEERSRHVQDALPQHGWVLGDRDGVQVHDAVQHGARLVLQAHPALDGPQVVAEVRDPCRLNAREHSPLGIFLEQRKTHTFASEAEPTNPMSTLPQPQWPVLVYKLQSDTHHS